ncbi:MAG: M20/M25/M40 family metallo-hydrolase, partial [Ignavibacteriales bacterium]
MNKSLLTSIVFFLITLNALPQVPLVQQIVNSTNQDSLVFFVSELSGDVQTIVNGSLVTILSRHKLQPGNSVAQDYIQQKLNYYGLSTSIHSFSTSGKNVIGSQTGTEFPNQKFIICAHYDDMPSGTIAPGADDNASGTAAVLEAARILSQYSFPYTIIYALWDEEEQGLVGSDYYATQAASAGDSILGVVNLDMVAWDSNNDGICNIHTDNVGITKEIYQKMVDINSQYGINLNIVEVFPAQPYSDHESFLSNGFAAVLLIEDDNDFHQYYHTVNDKVMYFNQPYYLKNTKLAIATIATYELNLNINLIHTPIASMSTSVNINTSLQILSGLNIAMTGTGAPRLYYRLDTGSGYGNFIEVTGTPGEGNTIINFVIPAPPLGSAVQYYLAAQDEDELISVTLPAGGSGFNPPGSTPPSEFYQFYVGPLTYALIDDASNMNNWTGTGTWGLTTLKFTSSPSSFTDSPLGNYAANVSSSFTLNQSIDLSTAIGAYLEFETQWNIEVDWDYGMVEISTNNGTTWTALEGNYTNPGTGSFQPSGQPLFDGSQLSWIHELMDISEYIGSQVRIRFIF